MDVQQNGQTALITGAASGIGKELAKLFAQNGYQLVLVDRDEAGLQQVAAELSGQHSAQSTLITKDLADPNAPEEIYAQTSGTPINVLVNDAGFGEYGLFATETNLQKELAIVQTNAVALMHLTKLYVKDMVVRDQGKILLLGSEVSVAPNPMQAVYGATKAFIKSFGEALRDELKSTGSAVTVTVLMPGATNTNFFQTAGAAHTKGADPKKTADPADVAKAGYDALMSGKDHVVAGLKNKLTVAMAHLLPDPLIAAQTRSSMMPKDEAAEKKQQQMVTAIAVGALALGSLWLLTRNRNGYDADDLKPGTYDKARYRYKAGKTKFKAGNALDSVTDAVQGAYHDAKATVEKALA